MNIAISRLHALARLIEQLEDFRGPLLAEELRKWGDQNIAEVGVTRIIGHRDLVYVSKKELPSFWDHHLRVMANQMSQGLVPLLETEEIDSFAGKIYQCRAFIVSVNAKKITADFKDRNK